ncbi:MAG: hypothetical protein FJ207_13910 [Gemmatimonadetes bacterium]|nr:hypothetical protein [Gemmatimonadota bacterium]
MSERRYSEEEIARIFERATEAQKSSLPAASSDGLTLREIQDVGRDVGLPPELVEQAARSLDMTPQVHAKMVVGLPVGVGRTVELGRTLTDAEWHRLVVDLRETFDARGRLSEDGPFKQWTNGNLQALLEPSGSGQRLRLKSLKGNAMGLMSAGLGMTGISATLLTVFYLRAVPFDGDGFWTLFVTGLAMLVAGAFQVPGWARERSRQMEEIIERLSVRLSAPPPSQEPAEDR